MAVSWAIAFITSANEESSIPTLMSSTAPRRITAIRGRVVMDGYANGSKSEREAVFIETPQGRFVLRRKAGPVFGDAQLETYVGDEVECDGFLIGNTLLAERIDVVM
jgi:hypothetical protein